jgi:hypothetical protein
MTPTLKHVLQPGDTGICGQACVAIIAGVSLHEAVVACGVSTTQESDTGGTMVADLARGLRKLGVQVGKPRRFPKPVRGRAFMLPRFALAGIADGKTSWGHWVVIAPDGFIYDPGIDVPLPWHIYEDFVIERAYSRRYKRAQDAGKRLKAKWDDYIPILGSGRSTK